MRKKILSLILLISLLLIGIKSYAGLQEAEQALQGVNGWTEEKLFIDSTLIGNKAKVDKLEKLKDLSSRRMKEYKNNTIIKNVYAYLYYKIIEVLNNSNSGGGAIVNNGSIPTPQTNNGKIPFESSVIKVDALGNVQIKENGKWRYYFPMCIYHDNSRTDRTFYTKGGRFNCIIAWDAAFVSRAHKAGLKSVLQLDQYRTGGMSLEKELSKIREMGLETSLIALYSDNEGGNRADSSFAWHRQKKEIADKYDKDPVSGKRMHPMYYLNGVPSDALRQDANGRVSDITGSYAYERWMGFRPTGPEKIIELENNGTKQPVVFAQLNFGVGGGAGVDMIGRRMTPIAMASVSAGAKGLGYWRDRGSTGKGVETHGFRDDLPIFRRDIEKLMAMGLIQQSHRSFSANCNGKYVYGGTRKLNGIGYIIISNRNGENKTVNCTIQNLGYTPSSLTDVLKGGNVGTVNGNSISVQVPAYHRVVVKLNK